MSSSNSSLETEIDEYQDVSSGSEVVIRVVQLAVSP